MEHAPHCLLHYVFARRPQKTFASIRHRRGRRRRQSVSGCLRPYLSFEATRWIRKGYGVQTVKTSLGVSYWTLAKKIMRTQIRAKKLPENPTNGKSNKMFIHILNKVEKRNRDV